MKTNQPFTPGKSNYITKQTSDDKAHTPNKSSVTQSKHGNASGYDQNIRQAQSNLKQESLGRQGTGYLSSSDDAMRSAGGTEGGQRGINQDEE